MSNPIHNIQGNWEMSLAGNGDKSTICTLIQTGTALTGIFHGSLGNLPIKGNLSSDDKIAFAAEFNLKNIEFSGMVDGKVMQGSVDFSMGKDRKNWKAIKIIDEQNFWVLRNEQLSSTVANSIETQLSNATTISHSS